MKTNIEKWLKDKNVTESSFQDSGIPELIRDIIYDYCTDVVNKNDLLRIVSNSVCPKCGSTDCDEDNNVKRCIDCYTIY